MFPPQFPDPACRRRIGLRAKQLLQANGFVTLMDKGSERVGLRDPPVG
jgi:hypothetical protein